jgi:hypothetical protein
MEEIDLLNASLAKFGQICEIWGKNSKKFSDFNENFEIRER